MTIQTSHDKERQERYLAIAVSYVLYFIMLIPAFTVFFAGADAIRNGDYSTQVLVGTLIVGAWLVYGISTAGFEFRRYIDTGDLTKHISPMIRGIGAGVAIYVAISLYATGGLVFLLALGIVFINLANLFNFRR